MAKPLHFPLSALLAAAALALAGFAALSVAGHEGVVPDAEAAASASCSVELTPQSRTVRRGGRVLLRGTACGAGASAAAASTVRVKLRQSKRWATVARARTDGAGEFSVCARVKVPRRAKVARLRAISGDGTGSASVRVNSKGSSSCTPLYAPPPVEAGNPDCPLSQPASEIGYTLPGACTVVASDTAANPDPIPFYGRIDCAQTSRQQTISSGGDPGPTATGGSQGDFAYRRMTVIDGDDYYGERCELGINDKNGPVAYYHEGMRRVTYASFKLNDSYPLETENWQGVMQLKQAQSSDNGGGTPVLSLGAYDGRWLLFHSDPGYTDVDEVIWEAPAYKNRWTRVAIDARFSQHASAGWVKMYIDLNADRDFSDPDEQSPRFQTNTLKYETGTDTSDGIAAGQSIPSHLRVGMYHAPQISCPAPTGCAVEADNIQVVKP